MVKLNYVKRNNSGAKLGAVVRKDVLKHSEPSKSRVSKDPHLEIVLTGKNIGDEGLLLACEGLKQALESGAAKLDDLSIAENELTVASLGALGEVVRLAAADLKGLDLAGNKLAVGTDEEMLVWEEFLTSFHEVCSLRRLDLSNNPIGDRGLEVLWRVYCNEPQLYLPRWSRQAIEDSDALEEDVTLSDTEELEELYAHARKISLCSSIAGRSVSNTSTPSKSSIRDDTVEMSSPQTADSSPDTRPMLLGNPKVHTQGLRSIPFFILSQTGGTDAGALFLSYLVEAHHTPQRLLPHLAAVKAGTHLEHTDAYTAGGSSGIVYEGNDLMTNIGVKLLQVAEDASDPVGGAELRRRRSSDSPCPSPLRTRRRPSMSAAVYESEVEIWRKKVQGAILKDSGIGCCRLWQAAMRTLVVSRMLFANDKGLYVAPDEEEEGSFVAGHRCLPESVWVRVLRFVADPAGLLSRTQYRGIITWAKDRGTLEKEMAEAGKLQNVQMWRVLDGMGCLSYEENTGL